MIVDSPPPISATPATPQTIRLYVAPLSPSLLHAILPKQSQSNASDISYHAPQTFPESSYGYITLSTTEAQKLKAKLHGSILRGVKMRIEEARPEKRRKRKAGDEDVPEDVDMADGANALDLKRAEKHAKREKRRERKKGGNENGMLDAIELPEGRSVKRGWTQAEGGKEGKVKREKRKHGEADKGEMVFRTNLPPNVAAEDTGNGKSSSKKSKSEKKSSKAGKAVELTEFSKTKKYPSFLRDSQLPSNSKRASEFVEGQGWLDEEGNVVEPATGRTSRRKHRQLSPAGTGDATLEAKSQETSMEDSNEGAESELPATPELLTSPKPLDTVTVTSPVLAEPKPIHPLEALFKRPAPKSKAEVDSTSTKGAGAHRPAPIKTSFSFFSSDQEDNGDDDDSAAPARGEGSSMAPPQTPFTRQDMELRGVRSAAPTPDTAALGRRFSMPWRRNTNDGDESLAGRTANDDKNDDDDDDGNDDEEDEENDSNTPVQDHDVPTVADVDESSAKEMEIVGAESDEQNEFEKHFWQHRGDYNRAWKARKREARKEVRQSENRKSGVGGR